MAAHPHLPFKTGTIISTKENVDDDEKKINVIDLTAPLELSKVTSVISDIDDKSKFKMPEQNSNLLLRVAGSISFQEGEKFPPISTVKKSKSDIESPKSVLKKQSAVSMSDFKSSKGKLETFELPLISKPSVSVSLLDQPVILETEMAHAGKEHKQKGKVHGRQVKETNEGDGIAQPKKKKSKDVKIKRKELKPIPSDLIEKLEKIILPESFLKMVFEIKPPQIKNRTYYSERISEVLEEDDIMKRDLSKAALSKWCLEWELNANEFAPRVKDFPKPRFNNVLIPPKDWKFFGFLAFPAESFHPKVQFIEPSDSWTSSKTLKIETKRRECASKYVPHILKEKYSITRDNLIPTNVKDVLPRKLQEKRKNNFLPLEMFDDESFDVRSPQEWIGTGEVNGLWNPVPALAFICRITSGPAIIKPPQFKLQVKLSSSGSPSPIFREITGRKASQSKLPGVSLSRTVEGKNIRLTMKDDRFFKSDRKQSQPFDRMDYNTSSIKSSFDDDATKPLKPRYRWCKVAVLGYDVKKNTFHVCPVTGTVRSLYNASRIYLHFLAEDPEMFAARVNNAVRKRDEAVNCIQYNLYLDCIPLSGGRAFDFNAINRLHKLTMCSKKIKDHNNILPKLKVEAALNYMKHFTDYNLRGLLAAHPELYPFIKPPKFPENVHLRSGGLIETCVENFQEAKKYWSWITLYVIPETYFAMCYVELECINLSKLSLFNITYCKNLSLEEFESQQENTINNTIKSLQIGWVPNTAHAVKMCLRDVGKGWFNVMESNWKYYEISKLYNLMNLIKFRMEAALKFLVLRSITVFVEFIEAPCLCTIGVSEDFVWGDDLINSQFKTHPVAIFLLLLKMNSEHAFYNANVYQFEKMLVNLFNTAILLSHKIPQAHPKILQNLAFSEDLLLSSIGLQELYVCSLRDRLELGIRSSIIPLVAYCKEYNRHAPLYCLDVDQYIEKFNEENHPANEVKEEIALQFRLKENLQSTIPINIIIGPFQVNVDPLKQFLVGKRHEMATKLLITFSLRMKAAVEDAMVEYKKIHLKLSEKPVSVEQVFEIKEWMETIPVTVKTQEENVKRLMLEYEVLDAFWWPLEQDEFEAKWDALSWPGRISRKMEEVYELLELEMETFHKLQVDDEFSLNERLEQLHSNVNQLQRQTDMDKVHEIANEVRKNWKMLQECKEFGQMLNQRQKLLGKQVTPFEEIKELVKEFEPYRNLWITASDWIRSKDIFVDNPLVNIDGESIDRIVTDYYKNISKAVRTFQEIPGALAVATKVKGEIDDFKPYIPLIQALRNPGLRKRHWEDFSAETGCQILMTPQLTFKKCLELGVEQHLERMLEMADHAGKEYVIEQSLDKMFAEWEHINIEIMPYKNTGTYIMKVTDDMLQMMDDHIVLAQQLTFSPFKGAFEQRIADWEAQLHLAQEVLDEWMECQRQWMYLEPIFTSEDITKQLPSESKKFNTMERTWRRVMKQAFHNPNLLKVCSDKRLLDAFKECNKLLEQVQKGLSDYLEMKRSVFPRFYFLSDDELLEILSQARNPRAVQPHLRKCFENIYKLTFEDDMKITQMFSMEGECVNLIPPMYPEGSVEFWLLKVEEVMKNSVRMHLKMSLDVIEKEDRAVWVLKWPGQVVIAGCQTYWTAHVEAAIKAAKLNKYYKLMLKQLDGLRGLVKGQLTRVERQVLSALIVIEVHARDVLTNLISLDVKNTNEFDWISQLRYYWIEEQLKVRAVNAEFSYGYEYLGNSGRLVITPLTDRCYLTLTGALHLKFGGAPAGPAGTGKTETTKDLAKAFAIQCVVFNCSDQLDFMAMGKFFKGLASSGAWACFDEFNRIDIEVLSVVAQQITTIQKAQMARADRFFFEGSEIKLNPACAVFITMNPGYAGRTELPDNLKALFRPVAMMVPDYTLIAEISLFSFGFSDAKQLAGKITTTFKLSSEQLSSQDHYDFGMRAVKTVIAVAGNLKRENPEMDERQIVLRSLRDVNVPKFLRDDLKLFNGIVSDLFPRMVELKVDYGELEQAIRKVIQDKGLEDVDGQLFYIDDSCLPNAALLITCSENIKFYFTSYPIYF